MVVIGAIAVGGVGTLIAWKMKKNKWMFGIVGAAVGVGVAVYINKNQEAKFIQKTK